MAKSNREYFLEAQVERHKEMLNALSKQIFLDKIDKLDKALKELGENPTSFPGVARKLRTELLFMEKVPVRILKAFREGRTGEWANKAGWSVLNDDSFLPED